MNKSILEELKYSKLIIRLLKKEIGSLESLILSVNPHYSDMPKGSPKHDKMSNSIAQLMDFKNKLNVELEKMVKIYDEVHRKLNMLENTNQRLVLSYRYVLGYKFSEIADEMCYKERAIYKIHERAVEEFNLL